MNMSEEIIAAERDYLINVLHKELIDSDERRNSKWGYKYLAKKYWPDLYPNGRKAHVHHIDFDKTNNVVSNLVVLTPGEHKLVHYMFDPQFADTKKKQSIAHKGKPSGKTGKKLSDDTKLKMSKAAKGKKKSALHRQHLSESFTGRHWKTGSDGKRIWYR